MNVQFPSHGYSFSGDGQGTLSSLFSGVTRVTVKHGSPRYEVGVLGHFNFSVHAATCSYQQFNGANTTAGRTVEFGDRISSGFCPGQTLLHKYIYPDAKIGNLLSIALLSTRSGSSYQPIKFELRDPNNDLIYNFTTSGTLYSLSRLPVEEQPTPFEVTVAGDYTLTVELRNATSQFLHQYYNADIGVASCTVPYMPERRNSTDHYSHLNDTIEWTDVSQNVTVRYCVHAATSRDVLPALVALPTAVNGVFNLSVHVDFTDDQDNFNIVAFFNDSTRYSTSLLSQVRPASGSLSVDAQLSFVVADSPILLRATSLRSSASFTFYNLVSLPCSIDNVSYGSNSHLKIAESTVAAALTRLPEFEAARMSSGNVYVRDVVCSPTKRYIAIGKTAQTISLDLTGLPTVRSLPYAGTFYLAAESNVNANLTEKLEFNTNTPTYTVQPAQHNSNDNLLLVIDNEGARSAWMYYVIIGKVDCVADPSTRVDAVAGVPQDASFCPVSDYDYWFYELDKTGVYMWSVELSALPTDATSSSINVWTYPYFYTDDSYSSSLGSISCSLGRFTSSSLKNNCTLSVPSRYARIQTRLSSGTVSKYTANLQFVSDCFDAGIATPTLNTGSTAIALSATETIAYCPSSGNTIYVKLPSVSAGLLWMDINHDSVPIPTYQTIPHYIYEVTVVNAAGAEVVPNHLFDVHPLPTDQSSNRYSHHVDAGDYYARIRFVNNSKAFDDAGQSSRWQPLTTSVSASLKVNWFDCVKDNVVHDTRATALLLQLDERRAFSLCPAGDRDYYRFQVTTTGVYNVTLRGTNVLVSTLRPSLMDAFETTQSPADTHTVTQSNITTLATQYHLEQGWYVFYVYSYSSSTLGPYDVQVTLAQAMSVVTCPTANTYEKYNTSTLAYRVQTVNNYYYTLLFCSARSNGEQWFFMDSYASYAYQISAMPLSGNWNDGEIELALFASQSDSTPFITSNSTDISLNYKPSSGQDTWLRVKRIDHLANSAPFQRVRLIIQSESREDYLCAVDSTDNHGIDFATRVTAPLMLHNRTLCSEWPDRYAFDTTTLLESIAVTVTPPSAASVMQLLDHTTGSTAVAESTGSAGVLVLKDAPPSSYELVLTTTLRSTTYYSLTIDLVPKSNTVTSTPAPTPGLNTNNTVCGDGIVAGDEVCDGDACCSETCKSFKPSGQPCIGVTNAKCELPRVCDGSSKTCPAERTAVAQGTVCRPAVDQCDLAEECDGEALGCPADRFSTGACDDNDMCTVGDKCDAGVCKPGNYVCDCTRQPMPDLACNDTNPCTEDKCGSSGCTNLPRPLGFECPGEDPPACTAVFVGLSAKGACNAQGACQPPALNQCPGTPLCSGHGTCCSNDKCACAVGFTGNACETEEVVLVPTPPPTTTLTTTTTLGSTTSQSLGSSTTAGTGTGTNAVGTGTDSSTASGAGDGTTGDGDIYAPVTTIPGTISLDTTTTQFIADGADEVNEGVVAGLNITVVALLAGAVFCCCLLGVFVIVFFVCRESAESNDDMYETSAPLASYQEPEFQAPAGPVLDASSAYNSSSARTFDQYASVPAQSDYQSSTLSQMMPSNDVNQFDQSFRSEAVSQYQDLPIGQAF